MMEDEKSYTETPTQRAHNTMVTRWKIAAAVLLIPSAISLAGYEEVGAKLFPVALGVFAVCFLWSTYSHSILRHLK